MFSSIDNIKEMEAVKLALNTRDLTKPSTECVLETLQFFLYNSNSLFDKNYLRKNGIAPGAPNSCLFSDNTIKRLCQLIEQEQINNFKELFYLHATGTVVLFCGKLIKTDLMDCFVLKCIRLSLNAQWK